MTDYRWMLDTNTAPDLVRNPHGRVYVRLERHGAATACLSIITAAELRVGSAAPFAATHIAG